MFKAKKNVKYLPVNSQTRVYKNYDYIGPNARGP